MDARPETNPVILKELDGYIMKSLNVFTFNHLKTRAVEIIKNVIGKNLIPKVINCVGVLRQSSIGGDHFSMTYYKIDEKKYVNYRLDIEYDFETDDVFIIPIKLSELHQKYDDDYEVLTINIKNITDVKPYSTTQYDSIY